MIRIAAKEDLPRVVELVKLGVEETKHPIKVQEKTLADSIYRSFMMAPCFLVENDGETIGCASLTLGNMPWSQQIYLKSNMVYVLPDFRQIGIIKQLYKSIKDYAELQGYLYADTFYSATGEIDGRARLARSQGLKITGISITYDGSEV